MADALNYLQDKISSEIIQTWIAKKYILKKTNLISECVKYKWKGNRFVQICR